MRLSEFDFTLPESLIALRPAVPRPASRLLVSQASGIVDAHVADLATWLRAGDLLVLNDTRVIAARLDGVRVRETADGSGVAKIAVNLIALRGPARWEALVRPAKKLRLGDLVRFGGLSAVIVGKGAAGEVTFEFDRAGDELAQAFEEFGAMPLPPYIAAKRPADDRDRSDYQTVFGRVSGAVAAPTSSLHFDRALLDSLQTMGVRLIYVTLHVGAGTFLPVKTEDVSQHKMHAEWGEVSAAAAKAIADCKARGGRVIAVGTTALRLIESAASSGEIAPFYGDTAIFITPGFKFNVTDALMTNFHLPKSTLLMLVAAFVGIDRQREIYTYAIAQKYRFFSYGDASLLLP